MGRGRARIALPCALRALWGRCSRTSRGIASAIGHERIVRAPLRGSVALREHRPQQFGEARAVAPIGQAHPTEHPTVAHDAESILAAAQRAGTVPLGAVAFQVERRKPFRARRQRLAGRQRRHHPFSGSASHATSAALSRTQRPDRMPPPGGRGVLRAIGSGSGAEAGFRLASFDPFVDYGFWPSDRALAELDRAREATYRHVSIDRGPR